MSKQRESVLKSAQSMLKRFKKYEDWLEYLNANPEKLKLISNVSGSPENFYNRMQTALTQIINENS